MDMDERLDQRWREGYQPTIMPDATVLGPETASDYTPYLDGMWCEPGSPYVRGPRMHYYPVGTEIHRWDTVSGHNGYYGQQQEVRWGGGYRMVDTSNTPTYGMWEVAEEMVRARSYGQYGQKHNHPPTWNEPARPPTYGMWEAEDLLQQRIDLVNATREASRQLLDQMFLEDKLKLYPLDEPTKDGGWTEVPFWFAFALWFMVALMPIGIVSSAAELYLLHLPEALTAVIVLGTTSLSGLIVTIVTRARHVRKLAIKQAVKEERHEQAEDTLAGVSMDSGGAEGALDYYGVAPVGRSY